VEFFERDTKCPVMHVGASPLMVLHSYPTANKWQVSWSSLSNVLSILCCGFCTMHVCLHSMKSKCFGFWEFPVQEVYPFHSIL